MNKRNASIAAAAISGVILAGAAAIATNTSILNAADGDNVGDLSAAAVVNAVPAEQEPQVIDIYIDEPVAAPSTTAPSSTPVSTTIAGDAAAQIFNIDVAGTVAVAQTDLGIELGEVVANGGWAWSVGEVTASHVEVTFTSWSGTFLFVADLADDGTIAARVDQPIVKVVHVPAPASSTGNGQVAGNGTPPATYDDDHDDDEDHDDGEYEDDDGEYEDDEADEDDEDDEDDDDHDEDDDRDDEREGGDDDD